ncbi:MAG: hypothetical protein KKG59_02160 [Nanoarchaeota archaeon]|nr:hypothetical protein [Nanoarchaeota archaeon]
MPRKRKANEPLPEAVAEPEEEEDMFADLLNQEIDARTGGGQEELGWVKPEYDPVGRIACVLEGVESNGHYADTRLSLTSGVLINHILGKNTATAKMIGAQEGNMAPADLAAIMWSANAVQDHRITPRYDGVTNYADYVASLATSFGQRFERLMKIDMGDETPVIPDQLIQEPGRNGTGDRYQEPVFTGFEPGVFMTANITYGLLEGYDEKLRQIRNAEELAQLVFLDKATDLLPRDEAEDIRKQAKADGDLTKLVTKTIVGLAIKTSESFNGMPLDEAVEKYERVLHSRLAFSQDLATQLEDIRHTRFDYGGMVELIQKGLDERRGIVFSIPRFRGEQDFIDFKHQLKSLQHKFYQAIEKKAGERFKRGQLLRTIKATHGDTYYNGTSVEELPIGTIGKRDSDGDFVPLRRDLYARITDSELQALEEMKLEPIETTRLRATVINGDAYTVTKKGSWGYVQDRTLNRFVIKFEETTGVDYRDPHPTFDIRKDHVTIEEETDAELAAKNQKIDAERRGIISDIDALSSVVEAEMEQLKARKKDLIEGGVQTLQAMGIPDGVIRVFYNAHLNDGDEYFGKGIIPDETIFSEIYRQQKQLNYTSLATNVVNVLREKMGVIIQTPRIRGPESYGTFKAHLLDHVLQGYRIAGEEKPKPRRKDTAGTWIDNIKHRLQRKTLPVQDETGAQPFARGDPVLLVKEMGSLDAGTVGFYKAPCNSHEEGGHDIDVPGIKDNACVGKNIVKLEKMFEEVVGPQTELKRGAKVKIRKDSEYYGQSMAVGKLTEDYTRGGSEHIQVRFENGYTNSYRQKDLELVNPEQFLTGKALKKHQEEVVAYEAKKSELEQTIAPLVAEAEQMQDQVIGQIRDTSALAIDSFRSMGYEDKDIYGMFQANLRDISYLKDMDVFSVEVFE